MSKRALRTQAARKSKRLRPVRSQSSPPGAEPSVSTSQTVRRTSPSQSSETEFDDGDSHEIETADRSEREDDNTAAFEDESNAPPSAADDVTVSGLLAQHDHEDRLLSDFFSSPPAAPSDALDESAHAAMNRGSRRAMWTAVSVFAASLLSIGGYTIYQQWIMPTPVDLGMIGDPGAVSTSNQTLTPVEHASALDHVPPPSAAEAAPTTALQPSPSLAEPGAPIAAAPPPSAAEPALADPVAANPNAETETTVQAITDR
ncbi:MAG TPA: hypothetical protein VHZ95_00445, partial [Polyangiales bacterium]|nr:hypothetical protein [Polyangiales bacterium]